MIVRLPWLIAGAIVVGAFGTASAANTKTEGCFSRSYDRDHLTRHPGQKTITVNALLRHDRLQLTLVEPARTLFISASCTWEAQAGRDIKGQRLLPAFRGTAAYDCIVTYSEESAEEGGYLIFAPTPDGTFATVYLDSAVAARSTPNGKAKSTAFGVEDRVFKLTRAPDATCNGLRVTAPSSKPDR